MAAAALAASAGGVACQRAKPQVAALPLEMGAAAPLGEAPAPGGLPPAPPARIATLIDTRDAYAYPDRAWGMSWAFGDSPPDYAFNDDGVTPWVWVADDDSERLAEPVPGGERYYYFEPGAYTPFYVQDPSYGYGFEKGQLVAIYARGGRQMAPSADPAAAATAGQYLARGRLLRQASASQPHRAVAAGNWNARRSLIAAAHASFARDAARDPAWLAYHDQHQAQNQARFASEATRRESWAAQTDSRLGQSGRAGREQQMAQSIAQGHVAIGQARTADGHLARSGLAGAAPTGPRTAAPRGPQHPGAALNRYAAARAERAQAQRAQAAAPSAGEHASDTAFQARAQTHAQTHARAQARGGTQARAGFVMRRPAPPPQQGGEHAFHAPAEPQAPAHAAAAQATAHAAAPPTAAAAAQPRPVPPAHAAPTADRGGGKGDGGDKRR